MIEIKSFNTLDDIHIYLIRNLENLVKNTNQLKGTTSLNSEYNIVSDIPFYYLLFIDGLLVSFLSIFMPKLSEVEISGFTHPDYRNKGYFSMLLDELKKELSRYGSIDLLFVCEYQSDEGIRYVKSLGSLYEFSEYELLFDLKRFDDIPKPVTNLTIEVANAKNLDHLIEIYQNTFHIPTDESKPMVMKTLTSEHKTQFIALYNGIIIGTCAVSYNENETYMLGVAINTPYQNQGHGKAFMIEVINYLLNKGLINLMIEVDSTNHNAYNLYQNIGFVKQSEFQYYRLKMDNMKKEG